MRILAYSPRLYLGDIYLSLLREGHDVRVFGADPPDQRAFGGILDPIADWHDGLRWVGRDGVVLFEGVAQGARQDALRAEGYRVVGGSALGDRLENDRAFGQAALRDAGLAIAQSSGFASPELALDWLRAHPGRYVLKHDSGAATTFVGDHPRGEDVAFMLRRSPGGGVLLMERLAGVEVGIGAYFDGQDFLRPACIDFEHKRFFPGEMGEMTGEMGTLASYEGAEALFEATLARVALRLRAAGHVGYVNLNLIVDAESGTPWPLEFTCRIGNPGFAVLAALQPAGWGDLLRRIAEGGAGSFPAHPGWSVAIVLTAPPFPATQPGASPDQDIPVFFGTPPWRTAEEANHHLVDARRDAAGQLLGHRRSGHLMIVTGIGGTVPAAQAAARARARNVVAPELRWRADIGDRFLGGEDALLRRHGWLPLA
ncbi:phosphoribosylamine--glycine ligase [Paracraurococcus ruber]|uniref:Phosphoribosylglycinamide synthetase C-domain domain-containing protein n=1 Tax=Paracraurococcus ruber TaxID=77675 RepID=A0ABS1CXI6_9PROT|nr:phosphoribosylamine--glycine ligase [Paracraurococcus ruber]MBK1659026.1 hypothetical protein [Paracraurococcus ruber]TDG30004.1 phosphoribosylamine--glycine ligase [Paracraurococcus ruber]